jgi:hypothetical protein
MPTHLYCLLPAPSDARPPAPARALDVDGLVAWVATTDASALSRDAREVARATIDHDRVVGAALTLGVTPVPAALADPYADDEAALRDLRAHAAEITAALRRVHGFLEMTIIVAVDDAPPPPDTPARGRAYLERLRGKPAQAAAIAALITDALRPLADEPRQRAEGDRVALSYLVSRENVPAFWSFQEGVRKSGFRVVMDGPRAPYSFARYSPGKGMA